MTKPKVRTSAVLDRETTLAKLNELKNKNLTANFFQTSRQNLNKHLEMWGIQVCFKGEHLKRAQEAAVRPEFQPGQFAMWVPVKARQRCYGHPIATMPVKVRILGARTQRSHYRVEIIDPKIRAVLQTNHTLHENTLREINE